LEQVLRSRHGSFAIDNHTNFDQYSSRVELVKAALNGLEDYVADEKQEIKLTKALSGKADVKSPLLAIQNALSQLHGAICKFPSMIPMSERLSC
jgi:Arc/MetJ-type ribon-helix-helix transcriptional regulator